MSKELKPSDEGLAHHEAGHAVIARVFGIDVTHVALFPTQSDNLASVGAEITAKQTYAENLSGKELDGHLAACENDAKVGLAGPLAQCHYQTVEQADVSNWQNGLWSSDINRASDLAGLVVLYRDGIDPGNSPDNKIICSKQQIAAINHLRKQWWKETSDLVEESWSAIERVAAALLIRPLINQEDLDALIAGRLISRIKKPPFQL